MAKLDHTPSTKNPKLDPHISEVRKALLNTNTFNFNVYLADTARLSKDCLNLYDAADEILAIVEHHTQSVLDDCLEHIKDEVTKIHPEEMTLGTVMGAVRETIKAVRGQK